MVQDGTGKGGSEASKKLGGAYKQEHCRGEGGGAVYL